MSEDGSKRLNMVAAVVENTVRSVEKVDLWALGSDGPASSPVAFIASSTSVCRLLLLFGWVKTF